MYRVPHTFIDPNVITAQEKRRNRYEIHGDQNSGSGLWV